MDGWKQVAPHPTPHTPHPTPHTLPGMSQGVAAEKLGVCRATINRIVRNHRGIQRKKGSGPRLKYGNKEVRIIEKAVLRNPFVTSKQIKMRNPKGLSKISTRTIRRILKEILNMHSFKAH